MLGQIIGIISISFFSRYFSKIELTAIPIYATVGSFGAILFGLGVFPVAIKLIPALVEKQKPQALAIAKSIIRINLIGGITYSILALILAPYIAVWFFHDAKYEYIIQLMCVGFFFISMSTNNAYLLKSFSRFTELSKVILYKSIIQITLTIVLSILFGWLGLVAGLVLGSLFHYSIGVFYLIDIYNSPTKPYPFSDLFYESKSFYLESFLMYLRKEGDILIVTTFLGSQSLAIYYIAQKVLLGLNSIYETLNSILVTKLSGLRGDFDKFRTEVSLLFNIQAFVLLPLITLFIISVPWLIMLIGGKEYTDSIIPGSILSLAPYFQFLFVLSFNAIIFLFLPGRSRLILTGVNTIFLLGSLLILSNLISINGVALARVLSFLLTGIFAVHIAKKNNYSLSFPIVAFAKMTTILVISFGYLILSQISNDLNLLNSIILFTISCAVFLVLVSLFLSEIFYATINQLSPIRIQDPIKLMIHEVRSAWNA